MKRYDQVGLLPRVYGHIQEPLDHLVYRWTSGRTTLSTWLGDAEMAMLTTTGAKTGLARTHVVLGLIDGEQVIVVASNYGRARHPDWYHNLKANPRASIEIAGVARDIVAHELTGDERDSYYRRAVDVYPGFTLYQRRARRRIPVLALTPAQSH
jgi:deazaflavin-dependent oxidoreductase (nitroreductase family)